MEGQVNSERDLYRGLAYCNIRAVPLPIKYQLLLLIDNSRADSKDFCDVTKPIGSTAFRSDRATLPLVTAELQLPEVSK
jgi:hypothetical protein